MEDIASEVGHLDVGALVKRRTDVKTVFRFIAKPVIEVTSGKSYGMREFQKVRATTQEDRGQ